jgi:RecB family exonuclease
MTVPLRLPDDFVFSQSSLQDYADCPRRFELRYVRHVAWPTPLSRPVAAAERHLALGTAFHRLAHQHQVGLDAERLAAGIDDPELARWWQAYLDHGPALPSARYPEIVLTVSVPGTGHRLLAKFDLLACSPEERLVIVDWKTSTRRPRREYLTERLQTVVYPYVLTRGGSAMNGGKPVDPATVEMIYWFPTFPAQPATLSYDDLCYGEDEARLAGLIGEIKDSVETGEWPEGDRCRWCTYATFCEQTRDAADVADFEGLEGEANDELDAFDLDLEQVAEVEF